MKQLVVGFDKFVNEMYEYEPANEKTSPCCGTAIAEDGTCEGCGNLVAEEAIENTGDENFNLPGEDSTEFSTSGNELPNVEIETDFAPTTDEFPEDELDRDRGDIEEMDPENARNAMYEARKTILLISEKFPDLKFVKKVAKDSKAAADKNKAAAKKGGSPFGGKAPAGKPGTKGVNPFAKKDLMTKDNKKAGFLDTKGKPVVKKDEDKKK
jgi:hypothetical protein